MIEQPINRNQPNESPCSQGHDFQPHNRLVSTSKLTLFCRRCGTLIKPTEATKREITSWINENLTPQHKS